MRGRSCAAWVAVTLGLLPACTGAPSSPTEVDPAATADDSPSAGNATEASLAAFLHSDERFDVLAELLDSRQVPGHETSFLVVVDEESTPGTLFAPTDAAFERLGDDAVSVLRDAPWLTSLLEKHIAHGTHLSEALTDVELQTWGVGSVVPVEVDGDRVSYGGAPVVEADIEVGEWVVHVIDGVVVPQAAGSTFEDA